MRDGKIKSVHRAIERTGWPRGTKELWVIGIHNLGTPFKLHLHDERNQAIITLLPICISGPRDRHCMLHPEKEGVKVGHPKHNSTPLSIGNVAAWMPARLCSRSRILQGQAANQLTSCTSITNCEEVLCIGRPKKFLNDDDVR